MSENCTVYYMDVTGLPDPAVSAAILEAVPEYRKRKVLQYRFAEGRRQSLGVGLLLAWALEERGVDGKRVRMEETPRGKPFLPEHPELQFSLSHSGRWALCAIRRGQVGCDAERIGRGSEKLTRRFFHPEEQAFLASLGPETSDAWQRAFTRLWTRKESFLKSTGEGLSRPLAAFSVLDGTKGFTFAHAAPDPAYDFCCCLPGEEGQVSWRRMVFEE